MNDTTTDTRPSRPALATCGEVNYGYCDGELFLFGTADSYDFLLATFVQLDQSIQIVESPTETLVTIFDADGTKSAALAMSAVPS